MLELDFNTYQERLKDQRKTKAPSEYLYEDKKKICLIFKNREDWEYYTVVPKETIVEFGKVKDMDSDESMKNFKLNYCYNCIPIKSFVGNETFKQSTLEAKPDYTIEHKYKKLEIDEDDDIVKDAESYSDFLLKMFDKFEKGVMLAVDKVKLNKNYTSKNFGTFVKDVFNVVNTVGFSKHIKKYIKKDMISGIKGAEDELDVDVGYRQSFDAKLTQLYNQQIDGYTINGKKWFGIKGVTKEIQADITKIVQEGILDNKSRTEVKDLIKGKFDKFSDWRSNMIARTETNRIVNEGKLLGYKNSGIEGGKVWKSAQPRGCEGCSEICDRLSEKYGDNPIPLDDPFIDPGTNKAYMTPPGHPHCKSVLGFRPF